MNGPASPSILGRHPGPWDDIRHWLVLAPHPDDFDVVAITLKRFFLRGARISLEVLSGGASGVEDAFVTTWEKKTAAREQEQRDSCDLFGLPPRELRFHRLQEDETGHMADIPEHRSHIAGLLEEHRPQGVILPHGNDSNPDHRRTFRWFEAHARTLAKPPLALLVRDPKTLGMRVDLITPYDSDEAAWKAELLRCHRSQHERNLRSRGIGFDERILMPDRHAAQPHGFHAAECFECWTAP